MATETCGEQVVGPQSRREPQFGSSNWESINSEDGDFACTRAAYGDDGRCRWHTTEEVDADDLVEELQPGDRIDGARFGQVDLGEIDFVFKECGLAGSEFNKTGLEDVDFVGSAKKNTVLRNATFRVDQLKDTTFERVQLNNATIAAVQPDNSTLLEVSFGQSTLTDTDFEQVRLIDCDFPGATLDSTTFEEAYQEGSTFTGATLSNVLINGGQVAGVDFRSVKEFQQVEFLSATVEACSFADVVDRQGGTSFEGSTIVCSSFNGGEFPQLHCNNLTAINTSLYDTQLDGADFTEATLVWTEFGGTASLTAVDFTGAKVLGMSVTPPNESELELKDITRAIPTDTKPQTTPRSTIFDRWTEKLEMYLPDDTKIRPETSFESPANVVTPTDVSRGNEGGVSADDLPLSRHDVWENSLNKQPTIWLNSPKESARVSSFTVENSDLSYSRFANLTLDEPIIDNVSLAQGDIVGIAFQGGEFTATDLSGVTAEDIAIPKTTFDAITVDNDTELFNRRRRRFWNQNPLAKDYLRPEIQAMEEDGSVHGPVRLWGILKRKYGSPSDIDRDLAGKKYQEASRQYKQLEMLFADNNDSRSTSNCFYRSQDTKRKRHRVNGNTSQRITRWFQRAVYGYGVRPAVVIRSILTVWLVFGFLFLYTPLLEGQREISPGLSQLAGHELVAERLYYSATTLTSVGLGDLTPSTIYGQILTGLEGFIGMTLVVLFGYVLGNRESW